MCGYLGSGGWWAWKIARDRPVTDPWQTRDRCVSESFECRWNIYTLTWMSIKFTIIFGILRTPPVTDPWQTRDRFWYDYLIYIFKIKSSLKKHIYIYIFVDLEAAFASSHQHLWVDLLSLYRVVLWGKMGRRLLSHHRLGCFLQKKIL